MRICFLNSTLDPGTGAGRFGSSLLQALSTADPALTYVVLTSAASEMADDVAILPRRWWAMALALARIRRLFRRCDIIHALDGYPYGVIAALAALGLSKKLVITAIGTGALEALRRPIVGAFLRWAYRRADRLVAVSTYTAGELRREVPGIEIAAVINHGVDAAAFAADGPVPPEIARLKPYILSVGAFKPRKGYRDSLRAFAGLQKSFPTLRYVIVGSKERADIDPEIERLGIRSSVLIHEGISDDRLRALYRNAELFVLLPYDADRDVEGFGLVFLEAAASGIPVVGTSESGAADAVAGGRNGFLVPGRDVRAAAEAMGRILADPALRRRLAAGSREFAAEMSWARAARGYCDLYAGLGAPPLLAGGRPAGL